MAKKPVSAAEAWLTKIEEYLNLASAWVIVAMLFMVSISVIMRKLLNQPIAMVYEVVELGMIILVFLGMAYTQRRGHNASVTFVYERFPARIRMYLDSITLGLAVVFWGLLTWQSILRTIKSWQMLESTMGVVAFPQYPGWTMIPVGAGLLTIELGLQFYRSLLKLKSTPDKEGVA